ncbi:MAG: GMC family oxidoreductase [Myxococcales bacterium]|nr:GMC family oxidoreductase [Myxococcales bacterium]
MNVQPEGPSAHAQALGIDPVDTWDAVVVGSGANGGVAAKRLSEAGLTVLVIDAGDLVENLGGYRRSYAGDAKMLLRQLISRRQRVQSLHATYWTTNPSFFVDDVDNPYGSPADKPFRWIRARVVGGRTLVWDGVTPRMSDFEFRAAERDGIGINWPMRHDDLAPYYGYLERYFGIHGGKDGLPQLPDGDYVGKGKMTAAERTFQTRMRREMPERPVVISRGIAAGRRPDKHEKHSKLSNLSTSLRDMLATRRARLETKSIVSRVLVEKTGRAASAVEYLDARSGELRRAKGRLIFLCASTFESVRILLNSATADRPGGLGSDSGALGRYVMDHVASNIYFQMPDVPASKTNAPVRGSDALMVPRYQNLHRNDATHHRGFGIWGAVDRIAFPFLARRLPGEAFGFLSTRGEVLPDHDNFVELDSELRDRWGVPCLRIHCERKDLDEQLARAARRAAIDMIEAVGGEVRRLADWVYVPFVDERLRRMEKEWTISTPGLIVHELGGARMGDDPRDSVVDSENALWDVPNVYVTDGACWPSSGWQNPTLTEMAITARAVDRAIARHR